MENQFSYSRWKHGGKIIVFSCKGSRKLSLFCPSLKPLLACARGMESQSHGPRRGFPWASLRCGKAAPAWKWMQGSRGYNQMPAYNQANQEPQLHLLNFVFIRKIFDGRRMMMVGA